MRRQREKGYYHAIPGRVRAGVCNLKNRPELARSMEMLLRSQPGVRSVRASAVTGRVLVIYDREAMSAEDVMVSLEDLGHCPLPGASRQWEIDPALAELGRAIGKHLAKAALKHALGASPALLLLDIL